MTQHGLPSAPSPAHFEDELAYAADLQRKAREEYPWLYPSGYTRTRREDYTRTRRATAGGSEDASAKDPGVAKYRHHLDLMGKYARQIAAASRGLAAEAGKLQAAMDEEQERVSVVDTTPAVVKDKIGEPPWLAPMTPSEAKAQKAKRDARVAEGQSPWKGQELYG